MSINYTQMFYIVITNYISNEKKNEVSKSLLKLNHSCKKQEKYNKIEIENDKNEEVSQTVMENK